MSLQSRREQLNRPYADPHRESLARKMAKPRNLLAWFIEGWRAEIPNRLHARGVWRAKEGEGSLIGSPRSTDAFRSYIEDTDPTEEARLTDAGVTVGDQAYRFPMRSALRSLCGRGSDVDPYPFMARFLFRTACMDGDWDAAARSMALPEPVRRVYRDVALERLWDRYREEPPPRTIRDSEVRAA